MHGLSSALRLTFNLSATYDLKNHRQLAQQLKSRLIMTNPFNNDS